MQHNTKKQITILSTPAQFERVLGQPLRVTSPFFVLHYCLNLSTDEEQLVHSSVDKCYFEHSRLGLVIPKRWAKSAVTRSLIKRQCRAQFRNFADLLPAGDWVIRLRCSFNRDIWLSCSSVLLKERVRKELQDLLEKSVCICHSAAAAKKVGNKHD